MIHVTNDAYDVSLFLSGDDDHYEIRDGNKLFYTSAHVYEADFHVLNIRVETRNLQRSDNLRITVRLADHNAHRRIYFYASHNESSNNYLWHRSIREGFDFAKDYQIEADTNAHRNVSAVSGMVYDYSVWVLGGNTTDSNQVWRSDTAGHTWRRVQQKEGKELPVRRQQSAVVHNGYMYVIGGKAGPNSINSYGQNSALVNSDDIYRSKNGAEWEEVETQGEKFPGLSSPLLMSHGGTLWVIGGDYGGTHSYYHAWFSVDDGVTWARKTTDGDVPVVENGKAFYYGGVLFAASPYHDRIWESRDGGVTWERSPQIAWELQFKDGRVNGSQLEVRGAFHNGKFIAIKECVTKRNTLGIGDSICMAENNREFGLSWDMDIYLDDPGHYEHQDGWLARPIQHKGLRNPHMVISDPNIRYKFNNSRLDYPDDMSQ